MRFLFQRITNDLISNYILDVNNKGVGKNWIQFYVSGFEHSKYNTNRIEEKYIPDLDSVAIQ